DARRPFPGERRDAQGAGTALSGNCAAATLLKAGARHRAARQPAEARRREMTRTRIRRTWRTVLAGVAVTALVAIPVEAQQAGTAKTEAEPRPGAEYLQQLRQELGRALSGPQADYVAQVGRNIALQSGLSNSQSAFTVTLLNSSVDNAFAIPGGYVYVTRQLVALMNNEAELAGVLGHE